MFIRSCSLFLLTVLTAGFLFAPQANGQSLLCSQAIGTYGQLKKDFKHNREYTKKISDIGEIKDQCELGTCTFMATISHLEQDYRRRTGKTLRLSTEYVAYRHWLTESIDTLKYELQNPAEVKPDSVPKVTTDLGSTILLAHLRIARIGLIPSSAWSLGTNFQTGKTALRIDEYVKNIIARAKWDMRKASSESTKEQILEIAKSQIRDVFENMVGVDPYEFLYNGKKYTPYTFADEFFPNLKRKQTSIYVKKNSQNPDAGSYVSGGDLVLNTSKENIENVARSIIDKGHAVFLSFGYDSTFVDSKTGIMSIEAFHIPEWAAPLNSEQATYYGQEKGLHAVQIVGYDLDPRTNRVRKWLIKNSWGESTGDRGLFHMYSDYFDAYLNRITFYSDLNIPIPKFLDETTK